MTDTAANDTTDIDKEYEDFWKPIIENEDGTINLEQLKRELADFSMLMDATSRVYDYVTNGQVSKPNVRAEVVISLHDDAVTATVEKAVAEELERHSALLDVRPIVRETAILMEKRFAEFDGKKGIGPLDDIGSFAFGLMKNARKATLREYDGTYDTESAIDAANHAGLMVAAIAMEKRSAPGMCDSGCEGLVLQMDAGTTLCLPCALGTLTEPVRGDAR